MPPDCAGHCRMRITGAPRGGRKFLQAGGRSGPAFRESQLEPASVICARQCRLGVCAWSGCPRAWRSSRQPLCRIHLRQRDSLGMTLAEFLAHPDVAPLREYGPCQVSACIRERTGSRSAYCAAHAMRWRRRRAAGPDADERRWQRIEPAVFEAGTVSLRGCLPASSSRCYTGFSSAPAMVPRHGRHRWPGSVTPPAAARWPRWRSCPSRPATTTGTCRGH